MTCLTCNLSPLLGLEAMSRLHCATTIENLPVIYLCVEAISAKNGPERRHPSISVDIEFDACDPESEGWLGHNLARTTVCRSTMAVGV